MAAPTPEALFAPVLNSEHLTYTLFNPDSEADVDFMINIFNVIVAGAGSAEGVWTAADVQRLTVNLMLRPSDTHGRLSKDPAVYIVHLGSTPGRQIGVINLTRRSSQIPPEFGFMLLPDYQRKGYGSEAVERVMRYWKDEFGIKQICAMTTDENIASQKLLTRVGLEEGGWASIHGTKLLAFILPGMQKLEGQPISFFGEQPTIE